ncbi:unnamed protein product [Spirodela intermedia]|uniref:Uncharacterized protein n=1 Tax=Spirodela intermedia TaxID=51605 RepID=A0A7I8K157_SPIIN|nr:unnamed protein product [Spirodela intermedia]
MEEREVVQRPLWTTRSKFNALTLSLEQYNNLDKISLDEVIGSLTIHELWLKDPHLVKEVDTMAAAKAKAVAIVDIYLLTTRKNNSINHKFNVTITLMLKLKIWSCLHLGRRLQSLRMSLKKVSLTNTSILLKFT